MKKILLIAILGGLGSFLQAKDALFSGLEIANRTKKPIWVLIKNGNALHDPRKIDPNGILTRKKDEKDVIRTNEPIKLAFFSHLPNIAWEYRLDEFLDTFNPNKFQPRPDKLYTFTLNKPIRVAWTDAGLQSIASSPNDVQNKDIEEIPLISAEMKKYQAAKASLINDTANKLGSKGTAVFKLLLDETKPTITEKDVYQALGYSATPTAEELAKDKEWKNTRKNILQVMHPDKMAGMILEGETPQQRKERGEKATIITKTVNSLS